MEKYLINIVTKNQVLDFAASQILRALELLKAPNMEIDLLYDNEELDGFTVDMNFPGGYGFIKGSNPRSVLFGVYRLMKSLGFRWIRPGKNGEVIPEVPKVWNYIRHWEEASAKLRAICIEGADSKENIIEMVDWMAKNFFNTFYLQSDSVFAFLERFYQHQGNPLLPQEDCTRKMGDDITKLMIKEMEKRGLILQQFGHGPTCVILGLSHWG
jgi:hypothetical protein